MFKMLRSRNKRRQRGQGMTEYIIIVALIAIGAIAVVTIFGDNIRGLFGASANALAGQATGDGEVATTTVDDEALQKKLTDFADFE